MTMDKLPNDVVLEMQENSSKQSNCLSCYFLEAGRNCPKEWDGKGGFRLSCANNRDVIFKEVTGND